MQSLFEISKIQSESDINMKVTNVSPIREERLVGGFVTPSTHPKKIIFRQSREEGLPMQIFSYLPTKVPLIPHVYENY